LYEQPDKYLVQQGTRQIGSQRTQYIEILPQNMACSHGIRNKHRHKVRIGITDNIAARTLSNEVT
jgi:hypothetical protein